MSDDWTANDPQWQSFVDHVRRDALVKMTDSAAVVSICPPGEPDIKFAVELGLAIMLDKPLLILVGPGRDVPEHLRRVADELVVADVDVEEGRQLVQQALERLGIVE
jgi:hypothetical protein